MTARLEPAELRAWPQPYWEATREERAGPAVVRRLRAAFWYPRVVCPRASSETRRVARTRPATARSTP